MEGLQLLVNSLLFNNNNCITKFWYLNLIFSTYTWSYWHCFTCSQNNIQNSFQLSSQHFKLVKHFKLVELNPYQLSPVKSSEHLVNHNLIYSITSIVQVLRQLPIITIVNHNLVLNSSSVTLLVSIFANFIPLSHHNVLWIFHSLPFLKN